jgi:hypothetical protein
VIVGSRTLRNCLNDSIQHSYCWAVPESPSNWDSEAGTRLWIRPGERLLWRGAPDPKVSFGPEDLILIPFSLLWGGFAIFWEFQASNLGWGFGSIWGIPFVLIGLYLIFGRFIYKRWNRRHTRYAISDQRIAVIRKRGRQVQSIARAEPFEVKRRRDGTHATLLWQVPGWQPPRRSPFGGSNSPFGMNFGDSGWPAGTSQRQGLLGFYDLTQGDRALAALRQLGA